ncbi:MAG: hypothetical protein J0L86_05595 [Flavobacteriales bacterium]|nr:hypothetical protein [Flavobacteriales bacterium]
MSAVNFLKFFLFFFSTFINGQNSGTAIRIFVEDAVDGKVIKDAKVTLEGFDIPEIVGKYDKKGKFYFFNDIPNGYNTVMVYHKKYNEKGFQDVGGLTKSITIKLEDKRFLNYSFEKPVLELIRKEYSIKNKYFESLEELLAKGEKVSNKHYKYLYNEDSYHIAIISKLNEKDFFTNDTLKSLFESLSLIQTRYTFGTEENYKLNCFGFVNGYFYKREVSEEISEYYTFNDFGTDDAYRVYFFHKKDKRKFDRFNCKEIFELRKHNLIVAVLTNRVIEYFGNTEFRSQSFEDFYEHNVLDNIMQVSIENYNFGKLEKSEQIFFKTSKEEDKMYYGRKKSKRFEGMPSSDDGLIKSLFFLIPKQNDNLSIGLGALDCSNETKVSFEENYYFFNCLRNFRLNLIK